MRISLPSPTTSFILGLASFLPDFAQGFVAVHPARNKNRGACLSRTRSLTFGRGLHMRRRDSSSKGPSPFFPLSVKAGSGGNTGNGSLEREDSRDPGQDLEALFELIVPFSAPIVAFLTYEYVAQGYSLISDAVSSNNWFAVDGGALQAKVITPAINGLVIPATTLLYATLTSTTVSTLRQRQVDIRKAINFEAGELRYLCQLVQSFPKSKVRDRCRAYLLQYTKRILNECQAHVSTADDVIDPRRGMETELNEFLVQLHRGYDDSIPSHLADESLAAIGKLREQRLNRLTALQSTYPVLHYATLVLLALAECLAFLMETNQDLLFFLNAFQLKLLWSILVGTFAACFTVFYDLLSPFSGSYQISASVDQIHGIRRILAVNIFTDETDGPATSPPFTEDGSTPGVNGASSNNNNNNNNRVATPLPISPTQWSTKNQS